MKKAITIQDIIGSIEYITIIDGKESKPSYGAVWSTWNQNITKKSEEFLGFSITVVCDSLFLNKVLIKNRY